MSQTANPSPRPGPSVMGTGPITDGPGSGADGIGRRGGAETDATGQPVVRIKGLRKSFGTREVLKGIDLTVGAGDVVCVIGPSGSGKSTLLRCVNLLEQ
ncbi:MAG: ATP-binding cassette domain-containing protein, partial [Bifidobacteriaceae bacterium]|nr:ATP-binding cassette domain-containing protein [Bifidobacteriaceae bacterium]